MNTVVIGSVHWLRATFAAILLVLAGLANAFAFSVSGQLGPEPQPTDVTNQTNLCTQDPSTLSTNAIHFCLGERELMNAEGFPPESPGRTERFQAAIEHYLVAVGDSTEKQLTIAAMERLVRVYGVDGLNDLTQAEAKMLSLIKAASMPDLITIIPRTLVAIRTLDIRSQNFETAMETLKEQSVTNPGSAEAQNFVASYYWDKAFRGFRSNLDENATRTYISNGLTAVNRALVIKPNYVEAFVYKFLLIRLQAAMEPNLQKRENLLMQANTLQQRAKELTATK